MTKGKWCRVNRNPITCESFCFPSDYDLFLFVYMLTCLFVFENNYFKQKRTYPDIACL